MYKLDYAALIRRQLARASRSPFGLVISAPIFTVGYVLLLTGLARLLADSLGWSANLLVVGLGALHVALGIVIVTAATEAAETVAQAPFTTVTETSEMALDRADTLVMDRPPTA